MATEDEPSAEAITTYDSGNHSGPPDLRFIHYNDVYHVEAGSREPVGGIARFITLCKYYQNDTAFKGQTELLAFFSGDALNPSLESSITKGKHMLPALNNIGTSAACLGNHDLDFGVPQFEYLASQCTFPWLCANVLDPALGDNVPLAHCKRTVMLTASNGIKIGVIGIVEREWLDTINSLPPNLRYESASATVAELAPKLKEEGAEMVIVLTHQREPNDVKLAEKLQPGTVDMILAGHDHFYGHAIMNGTHILRSGTDFKQLSYLEARRRKLEGGGWDINILRRDIVSSIPEDPTSTSIVSELTSSLRSKLDKPIGYTAAPLDARFTTVRLKESNLGNFICDLMRFHYFTDCAIMAAGTVRGDQIYPVGVLRLKDLMSCFPFEDPCVVIAVKGKDILAALENGVSKYPALEGRFPQVSGITFSFDPSKAPGHRCSDMRIKTHPLELEKEYTLATRAYMVQGKDGFTSLKPTFEGGPARTIVSEENGMLISAILRQYFMSLKVLGKWQHWNSAMERHWDAVHEGLHVVQPVTAPGSTTTSAQRSPEVKGKSLQVGNGHITTSSPPAKRRKFIPAPEEAETIKNGEGEEEVHHAESEDEEDDPIHLTLIRGAREQQDRQLFLKRKYSRKWWRLARMPGHPNLFEESAGDEEAVTWAMGIAPRVEGRIKIIGAQAEEES